VITQLFLHVVGDYVIQSNWMAQEKTKSHIPALAHALTYSIPFAFLTQSPAALGIIFGTHFIIDRWRLARYVCWFKNQLVPAEHRYPWKGNEATGYKKELPDWLAVWLMIIVDNVMHVTCNALAIGYL